MDASANKTRLKHIDVRQQWVKTLRDQELVQGVKISSEANISDIGTKILPAPTFLQLRNKILHQVTLPKKASEDSK